MDFVKHTVTFLLSDWRFLHYILMLISSTSNCWMGFDAKSLLIVLLGYTWNSTTNFRANFVLALFSSKWAVLRLTHRHFHVLFLHLLLGSLCSNRHSTFCYLFDPVFLLSCFLLSLKLLLEMFSLPLTLRYIDFCSNRYIRCVLFWLERTFITQALKFIVFFCFVFFVDLCFSLLIKSFSGNYSLDR